MSSATQNLPDDPAFLKAMIAALLAENAKMSATLQVHDQLIPVTAAAHRQAEETGLRQVLGKDRTGNPAAGIGAGRSFNRRGREQHHAAR